MSGAAAMARDKGLASPNGAEEEAVPVRVGEGAHALAAPAPDDFRVIVPGYDGQPRIYDRAHVEFLLSRRPTDPTLLALLQAFDHVEGLTAELRERVALAEDDADRLAEIREDLRALEQVERGQRAEIATLRDDLRMGRAQVLHYQHAVHQASVTLNDALLGVITR